MEKASQDLKKYVVHPESTTQADPKPIVSGFSTAANATLCSTGVFSSTSHSIMSEATVPERMN